jgi:hypothetical protein
MIIESEVGDRGEGGGWGGDREGSGSLLGETRFRKYLFGDDKEFGELIWMRRKVVDFLWLKLSFLMYWFRKCDALGQLKIKHMPSHPPLSGSIPIIDRLYAIFPTGKFPMYSNEKSDKQVFTSRIFSCHIHRITPHLFIFESSSMPECDPTMG